MFFATAAAGTLTVNGRKVRLNASSLIGNGGEAEVYDIGGGRALKHFKGGDHPDYASSPDAQAGARERLKVHQKKLPALMNLRLPAGVVAPLDLALDGREVRGYTMDLVPNATVLMKHTDKAYRSAQSIGNGEVIDILSDLHATVAALHAQGVVIADFNDLNVLVTGRSTRLIDIDSAQFGPFASMLYTARFLDPRLTDGRSLAPVRPHDFDSDWYAFAVMAFQLLLFVDPYGGVCPNMTPDARRLQRVSVFHPGVRYPRHALPVSTLPPDLAAYFREVFDKDRRGEFPLALLRPGTVAAAPQRPRLMVVVRGNVRAEAVDALPSPKPRRRFHIEGGTLYRDGSFGPEAVGSVLGGLTRVWAGPSFGFGFYRASEMTVGFVFDAHSRGIRDDVELPPIGGQIVDATALFTDERCWFFLATQEQGRLRHRCTVLRRDGSIEATLQVERSDDHWLGRIHGHAAAANFLLAATDDGIVRIEPDCGTLRLAATFPDTEGLVDSSTVLAIASDGLYASDSSGVRKLTIG